MRRTLCLLFMVNVLISLGACSFWGEKREFGRTLADLPEANLPPAAEPVPPVALDQIEESYRAALAVAADPALRHRIQVRLADIEMARGENRQLTQAEEQEHFRAAIALYDQLLQVPETRADKATDERLLYRLSKAYALDGRMAESDAALERLVGLHPDSPFAAEAEFRRAEQAFSAGQYRESEALYERVLTAGTDTPFYLNALYMKGWSQFKASDFDPSVDTFTQVLDKLHEGRAEADLSNAQRSLMEDTLRVLGIAFTYLDGAPAIAELFATLGERPYQHRMYQSLGNLYLEKKRYKDAADTFSDYIERFPASEYGPEFAVQRIGVYTSGGFPDQVLPAKEDFVRQYGIDSAFWAARTPEQRLALQSQLGDFLDELSSYYHAEGQALLGAQTTYQQQLRTGKKPKVEPAPAAPQFLRAAGYYDQYLRTFPASPRLAEVTYLMGDAYFEAGDLPKAVSAYETVAYEQLDAERGAKAGYAAIVALQTLLEGARDDEARLILRDHKIRSAISFSDYYPQDPRAVAVLTQAAQEVFNGGDQAQAVALATRITQWQPPPEAALRKSAWLILAHSQFDTADYNNAEQSYGAALALMPPEDPDRAAVTDRIAASIYKSAEQLVAAGSISAAVTRLLEVEAAAPGSDIAIRARYDAGNYLMEQKDWAGAERVFSDFQQRFGKHELAGSLGPKMAVIYQETAQWDKAAGVLALMAASSVDPEARRQSLYMSAELYQKSGRSQDAADRYAEYVKAYPQPFALATEARYQLLQLAQQSGDDKARRYWLNQLIETDAKAGADRSDRSRYLAAYASSQFAGEAFSRFESIKLTLPIKKSLTAKKGALDETLKAYKKVLDYGVAEFVTEANYRIGNIYSQLSRDLMNSERPKGLDELALEQYEILLEEQAYPFEEKSVELLAATAERSWEGLYDKWVKQSFTELAKILPARYGKQEQSSEVSDGLH
jgi:TolA-binding protein